MTTKVLSQRQARWALALSAYDFEITYRPGRNNTTDPPSRRPDYELVGDEENIMLPTLQKKLQLAMKRGLVRDSGIASESTESTRGVTRVLAIVTRSKERPSGGYSKAMFSTEAH